jgi:hypothetical protein
MAEERYPKEDLTQLPPGASRWSEPDDNGTMSENVETLEKAIVGHKIVKVEENARIPREQRYWGSYQGLELTLDDGRKVYLADTSDCCAYTGLEGVIKHLDQIDHVIMGVGTTGGFTKWHIYADLGDVLELDVSWSAGNPFYYGYGFDILVVEPEAKKELES